MTGTIRKIVELLEVLPAEEQKLALEVVKRFALALDSEFVSVKPKESKGKDGSAEVKFDLDDIEQFR